MEEVFETGVGVEVEVEGGSGDGSSRRLSLPWHLHVFPTQRPGSKGDGTAVNWDSQGVKSLETGRVAQGWELDTSPRVCSCP